MEQKIIFFDIDGTIAEPGGSVPVPSALEAMKRAKAKGHKVVLCSGRSRDVLHSMLDFDFDAVVTNGELIHRRHSKGAAVRVLCEHWGLPLSDSIAFGDSMNDTSMLTTAGLGICMGNGGGAVKALADEVCLPYDQAGVLRALEDHGLI